MGAAIFSLRDRELTLELPSAADGAAAGVYRMRLDRQDALLAIALEPPTVAKLGQPQTVMVRAIAGGQTGISSARALRAGSTPAIPVIVVEKTPGPRYLRALPQGGVVVRLSDGFRELFVRIASKPVRGGVTKP